jgi:predicted acyl esterase
VSADPVVRANLRIPAEDGTALATDVYTPDGPAPVLVLRTCYGRSAHLAEGLGWARRGFAFVVQDVRGRYDSDGIWQPYQGERADGRALARWVAGQSWCDGRIVPIGASYAAYTAWAIAVSYPVTALVSQVPAMGVHRVKFEPGGILRLAEHANWWLAHAESRTSRADLVARHPYVLDELPVSRIAERFWPELSGWWPAVEPWTDGPAPPPEEAITDTELADVDIPTLHCGGWRDLLRTETLHQWRTVPGASLVAGPWDHELPPLGGVLLDWLSAVFDDRPNWTSQLLLAGEEEWRQDVTWPSARSFSLGGGRFRSDPLDPYPSVLDGQDRSRLSERTDALRFPVVTGPVTVLGSPEVVLDGEILGAGADWVVRLIERRPDGTVRSLARGVSEAGSGRRLCRIPLRPAGVTVTVGGRLEVEVAGSDFPFLARNLGTGQNRYTTCEVATVEQVVHGGSLALPVLED